ncbi:ribosomal protein S6, partial [Aureobasidium melanogenum]
MLYELIGVVRPGNLAEVRESVSSYLYSILHNPSNTSINRIAKTTGNIVLNSGGVVRGITNWGVFHLPKPMRKNTVTHNTGHYFVVRFDSSARTQHAVRRTLGLDPRMLRYSVVKMGGTLDELRSVVGEVQWRADADAVQN